MPKRKKDLSPSNSNIGNLRIAGVSTVTFYNSQKNINIGCNKNCNSQIPRSLDSKDGSPNLHPKPKKKRIRHLPGPENPFEEAAEIEKRIIFLKHNTKR